MKKIDVKEDLFKFFYGAAVADATQQQAYNATKAWMKDTNKLPQTCCELKRLIEDIQEKKLNSQKEYDDRFLKIAKIVSCEVTKESEKYNGRKDFTFGNTQKLINILLKEYYFNAFNDTKNREGFKFCHCPMDRKMMEHVWEKNALLSKELQEEMQKNKKAGFTAAWSKLTFENDQCPERYKLFQKAILELCNQFKFEDRAIYPLEYDYHVFNDLLNEN